MLHVGLAGMWAQEVSEKEAQERAQTFVKSHYGRKGGGPELKSLGQVNGLYVFNMNDKGGFVIVSNDKRTTPILGYSESGTIDPDNMPDVMKAWFQGYADEIAWAQKNIKENSDSNSKVRARTRSHATTTIAPLVKTTWDQIYPYNAFCNFDNMQCVTGCAATAMAQVMYYTEMKAGNNSTTTTAQIPSYTTSTHNFTIGYIPKDSEINWSQMIFDYSGSYTGEQATAIARLMLYCGCSIKMNYGLSSSASVSAIAVALKNYFGYSETTTHLERYNYTYTDWVDMIYNELSNGRPVLYAGQAVDNGHGFVCDGYQYDDENDTDLFHINWGWSGSGDGYFVLSVLNPDQQGTGGSATNSAYTFGQEAIVGIQKIGGTGSVLNVKPLKTVSLDINSISLSHSSIALGESVTATVSVTNNGVTKDKENDDYDGTYDGEICLFANGKRYLGKIFQIASGATQNCVFTISPEVGSYSLDARYPLLQGDYGTGTSSIISASLTVTDQTPSNLTVTDITPTSATIGWTNVGSATKWNLRSRTVNTTLEDFNNLTKFEDIITDDDGWQLVRFTNSNNILKLSSNGGINNSKCLISPSYENGTDINPKGGLRTPKLKLDGSISFYAWGEGENFQLYLSTNGRNYTSYINPISTTNEQTRYDFDLSQYAELFGMEAYVAIIHCNSSGHTSDSYLYIDNVSFTENVGEWTNTNTTNTNKITSPYILRELAPETGYEVQVQAVNNDGGKWSDPIIFKSEALSGSLELGNENNNDGLIEGWNGYSTTVTLKDRTLYKDGEWNTICLPFDLDADQIANSDLAGADIRTLSTASLSDAGLLTLNFTPAAPAEGAVTAIKAGTPYIIKWDKENDYVDDNDHNVWQPIFQNVTVDKTMCNKECDLGGNKKITFKGTYTKLSYTADTPSILFLGGANTLYYPENGASIGAQRAYFELSGLAASESTSTVRAFALNFGDDTTGIISIENGKLKIEDDSWYDLSGRKLNEKPVKKGVYVQNGKKVVIK